MSETQHNEENERQLKKNALERHIEQFFRNWSPEESGAANRFHAELLMLVMSIADHMGEPLDKTLRSVLRTMAPPIFLTGEKPNAP